MRSYNLGVLVVNNEMAPELKIKLGLIKISDIEVKTTCVLLKTSAQQTENGLIVTVFIVVSELIGDHPTQGNAYTSCLFLYRT